MTKKGHHSIKKKQVQCDRKGPSSKIQDNQRKEPKKKKKKRKRKR